MPTTQTTHPLGGIARDLIAGLVVFLVALPLCLGVAAASNAPMFSGILAGIIGGILVGVLSGSHTSVSGPAAGLTAVVALQIGSLGSFETFLAAVLIAGVIQIGFGLLRGGLLAAFFPSSVIKGLLAAIGVILILKQIPHVVGHDADPEGEMNFVQPDNQNTFSEIAEILSDSHLGAAAIGLFSIAFLLLWDRSKTLKKSIVPAPLLVVLLGVTFSWLFGSLGANWDIGPAHKVQVPVANTLSEFIGFLRMPAFDQLSNSAVYKAGITIAIVASLETLLNLQAVDKLDPHQRVSPPNRELMAQGVGNIAAGLLGGIPVTSVIVRSSVNINAGAQTKLSAIFHGILLLVSAMLLPTYVNMIPISCLAAIMVVTGLKLASPDLFKQMWKEGRYQFLPFIVTLVAIVLSDLLVGIIIGFAVSLTFILNSNLRRPLHRVLEKRLGGDVLHIELANQVSFLNRAALERVLREVPRGGHVLLDARSTDYIDPDILSLIREFKEVTAPVHGVQVSLQGFRQKYLLHDDVQFVDYSTRELQDQLTSAEVLHILREGNERFRTGRPLSRDVLRQLGATSKGQHPLAVVLSCIDSRTPAELIFDLGLGDIFSVRIAGNIISPKILGSIEYGCAVAGAKLILIMGHTRCGAVTASVRLACDSETIEKSTGCQHLEPIVQEIQQSVDLSICRQLDQFSEEEVEAFVNVVSRQNVERTVREIVAQSRTVSKLIDEGRLDIVGALYDITTGRIDFMTRNGDKSNWEI